MMSPALMPAAAAGPVSRCIRGCFVLKVTGIGGRSAALSEACTQPPPTSPTSSHLKRSDHARGRVPAGGGASKARRIIVKVGDTDVHNPERDGRRGARAHRADRFVVRRTEGATTTEISTMVDIHADPTLDFDTAQAPSTVAAVGISGAEFGPGQIEQLQTR